jgi:adenylate kinase family enzyme
VKRVAVIGSGGAGKSVFSRQLGDRTGLPVFHLDALHWRPGWVEPPNDEWAALNRELVKGERWIIDGNYGGTMEIRLPAADTVVFLDLPRLVCLWSVISRWARHRRRTRPDMAPGLNDKLDPAFLRWIWDYPRTRRPGILQLLATLPPTTRVVRLRSRRAMREFLASVAAAPQTAAAAAP